MQEEEKWEKVEKAEEGYTKKRLFIVYGLDLLFMVISILFFRHCADNANNVPSRGIEGVGYAFIFVFIYCTVSFFLPFCVALIATMRYLFSNHRNVFWGVFPFVLTFFISLLCIVGAWL